MSLLVEKPEITLWQEAIKQAENRCSIDLNEELETYLISLLMRYAKRPELVKQLFGQAFLEALQQRDPQRLTSLQHVGDQCLLFAGLFPDAAKKRHVKIAYFVDLGRSAYAAISATGHDLYWTLAFQFIALMDVLQSIRPDSTLLPLEAYERWTELGSQRALQMLKVYTQGFPHFPRRP